MTQKEYNKMYREAHKEEIRQYQKEYRESHKEKMKDYNSQYYDKNKEALKQYQKDYATEHKDKISAHSKKYYAEHRDKIKEKSQKYYEEHKEEANARTRTYWAKNRDALIVKEKEYRDSTGYNKKYRGTKEGRANNLKSDYNRTDREKGMCNDLTQDWIIEHILNSKCIYCGESDWHRLGCDRIDNNLPHTTDNCICACGICNVQKADNYTVEEFIEYRKTHPRVIDLKPETVEVDGIIVLKKRKV